LCIVILMIAKAAVTRENQRDDRCCSNQILLPLFSCAVSDWIVIGHLQLLRTKSADILDHLISERIIWETVARRVIRTGRVIVLSKIQHLHNAVIEEGRKALAAALSEERLRSLMRHSESECVGQFAVRVRKEIDHCTLTVTANLLVVGPCVHHGTVINAEHNDFVDP